MAEEVASCETKAVWSKEEDVDDPDKMHGITAKGMSSEAWVNIQKRTFERWVNTKLAERDMHIDDLATGFSDGVKLINLLEILSELKAGRYVKSPRMRIQYFNNHDLAFKFLKNKCEVKVVNIGAEDIVDGNLNTILGLVWSLISKYAVTLGRVELVSWIKKMVGKGTRYGVPITNIKPDLQNGKLLGSMCHSIDPNSIDMDKMGSDNLTNVKYAMECAKEIGVPEVLTPEDFVNPECDELSLMTYISGFNALKPDGPDPEPRADGFLRGLYVDVNEGPESNIEYSEGSGVNERKLVYVPEPHTDGSFHIDIFWKGKKMFDTIVVES